MVPNPDLGTTAMKLFNCWNSLLACDCDDPLSNRITNNDLLRPFGIPSSFLTSPSEAHEAKDVENPSKRTEKEPKRRVISPQLELQADGSYRVSVYDVSMAIIKLAGLEKFDLFSEKYHRLLMQVRLQVLILYALKFIIINIVTFVFIFC